MTKRYLVYKNFYVNTAHALKQLNVNVKLIVVYFLNMTMMSKYVIKYVTYENTIRY